MRGPGRSSSSPRVHFFQVAFANLYCYSITRSLCLSFCRTVPSAHPCFAVLIVRITTTHICRTNRPHLCFKRILILYQLKAVFASSNILFPSSRPILSYIGQHGIDKSINIYSAAPRQSCRVTSASVRRGPPLQRQDNRGHLERSAPLALVISNPFNRVGIVLSE